MDKKSKKILVIVLIIFGILAVISPILLVGSFIFGQIVKNSIIVDSVKINGCFLIHNDNVHYYKRASGMDVLVNTKTRVEDFTVLNNCYGKNNKYVFAEGRRINGADSATFELLDGGSYSRDKQYVYRGVYRVKDADPATFRIFGSLSHYTADKNFVFKLGKKNEGADPATFTVNSIDDSYSMDKNYVFYNDEIIEGANPNYWQLINPDPDDNFNTYSKDINSKKIFHNKDTIDADYDSFEILVTWNDLSKDKNHVFYNSDLVQGLESDKMEFVCEDNDFIKDDNQLFVKDYIQNQYKLVEIENVDAMNFRVYNNTEISVPGSSRFAEIAGDGKNFFYCNTAFKLKEFELLN